MNFHTSNNITTLRHRSSPGSVVDLITFVFKSLFPAKCLVVMIFLKEIPEKLLTCLKNFAPSRVARSIHFNLAILDFQDQFLELIEIGEAKNDIDRIFMNLLILGKIYGEIRVKSLDLLSFKVFGQS
jgi:hypothetical protein